MQRIRVIQFANPPPGPFRLMSRSLAPVIPTPPLADSNFMGERS
jgi:hypothetical protein